MTHMLCGLDVIDAPYWVVDDGTHRYGDEDIVWCAPCCQRGKPARAPPKRGVIDAQFSIVGDT